MSDHHNIEELIRSKLGDAELTPSAGAWKAVQRKLRMKQFLRFDPSRFNIWYAGTILVAGAVTLSLLYSKPSPSQDTGQRETVTTQESAEMIGKDQAGTENQRKTGVSSKAGEAEKQDVGEDSRQKEERERRRNAEKLSVNEKKPVPLMEEEFTDGDLTGQDDSSKVLSPLVADFRASQTEGCAPLRVEFMNLSLYAASVSWSFGDGNGSEAFNPVYTYTEAGTYAVAMNVTGEDGQVETQFQVIKVYPPPVAAFEMGEGLESPDGIISIEPMNYSSGGFSYSWDFLSATGRVVPGWSSNEFQPIITNRELPLEASMVRMVVMNEHGCTDTAVAEIAGLGAMERTLVFPTAFSGNRTGPTGGHYNPQDLRIDVFHPHFSEEPAEYHLQVFSKMGELIFETRDILQGWDGYYMQEQTAGGVYLWVAEGTWQNGSSFSMRGDVTLLWTDRR